VWACVDVQVRILNELADYNELWQETYAIPGHTYCGLSNYLKSVTTECREHELGLEDDNSHS
jgi:hypothetical protein